MRKSIALIVMSAMLAGLAINVCMAEKEDDDKKEKKPMSIHDVMEKGFKGGKSLYRTVISKKKDATKEENEKFLGMLKDLTKNKPPMGDEKSWEKFTKALVEPMEKIAKGEDVEKSKKELGKAAACTKCHNVHRPKKK